MIRGLELIRDERFKILHSKVSTHLHVPHLFEVCLVETFRSETHTENSMSACASFQDIEKWVQPTSWKDALRRNYPFKCEKIEFPLYKECLKRRLLDDATCKQHVLSMRRFVNMFEPVNPLEKLDLNNIILNVYHCDLFEKLQKLPLCAADYSCTLSMTTAVAHYGVMTRQLLYKKDAKARADIKTVLEDVIKPWSTICNKVRDESEARKYAKDAKLLANYHSRDELKEISRQCYLALKTIHHHVVASEEPVEITKELLFKATANNITVLFTNSSPNRSKEVETLENATVQEFLAEIHRKHLESDKYKTVGKYGKKGWWMHEAHRLATKMYDDIVECAIRAGVVSQADPEREFFFQLHPVKVHTCIRSVCRDLGILDKPLSVTLLRKLHAKMARKRDTSDHPGLQGESAEELFERVAHGNKHRTSVADKYYAVLTPEEDAMLSQHNYLRIMGEPVEFPSFEDWMENGPSLEAVLRRCAQDCEADDQTDAGSDIDEDDDDEKLAAELFGQGDDWMNVDDVRDDEPEDRNDESLEHILALCDIDDDVVQPHDACEEQFGAASVDVDAHGQMKSSVAIQIASSPDTPTKNAARGKTTRQLQKRLSMHKKDKKKEDERQKREKKKMRKAAAMSDDMSEELTASSTAAPVGVVSSTQAVCSTVADVPVSSDETVLCFGGTETTPPLMKANANASTGFAKRRAPKLHIESCRRPAPPTSGASCSSQAPVSPPAPRHTTKENIAMFFGKKAAPAQKASESLSAFDMKVLDALSMKKEQGGNTLSDDEKKFLVKELRSHQGDLNSVPVKHAIEAIIRKGLAMDPPTLEMGILVDDIFYHGVIKRFFKKFSTAAAELAQNS